MSNPETILRTILGPIRSSIRPLVSAVEVTDNLLFTQHVSMDDIQVTKHVYPDVARTLNRNPNAVSRQIERLSWICWDSLVAQQLVPVYLGQTPPQAPPPHSLLVYLAVFSHLGIPFSAAIKLYPHLLIQPQIEE